MANMFSGNAISRDEYYLPWDYALYLQRSIVMELLAAYISSNRSDDK